jgi:hypothetical protein
MARSAHPKKDIEAALCRVVDHCIAQTVILDIMHKQPQR